MSMLPLSPQEMGYFIHRADRNRMSVIQLAFQLSGDLDLPLFSRSLDSILYRHDILRTSYGLHGGTPCRIIHNKNQNYFQIIDLTSIHGVDARSAITKASVEVADGFDITSSPPFSIKLFHLALDLHILLISAHHILFDGFSFGVFLKELATFYNLYKEGVEPPLDQLPIQQYSEFAYRQSLASDQRRLDSARTYWQDKIYNYAVQPNFPVMLKAAADCAEGSPQFGLFCSVFPEALFSRVREFSYQQRSTLYLVLLGALYITLSEWTDQRDVSVLCPIATQPRLRAEQMMGCCVNAIFLQYSLEMHRTFSETLEQLKKLLIREASHARLPYTEMHELLAERMALVPVVLNLVSLELPKLNGVVCTQYELNFESPVGAQVPNQLLAWTFFIQECFTCKIHYNAKLVSELEVKQIFTNFCENLDHLTRFPNEQLCMRIGQ